MMSWIFEYFQTYSLWQSFVRQIVGIKCRGFSAAAYEELVHLLLHVFILGLNVSLSFVLSMNIGIRIEQFVKPSISRLREVPNKKFAM
jgi:hypothetical protein